jgi:hypothetical protein
MKKMLLMMFGVVYLFQADSKWFLCTEFIEPAIRNCSQLQNLNSSPADWANYYKDNTIQRDGLLSQFVFNTATFDVVNPTNVYRIKVKNK